MKAKKKGLGLIPLIGMVIGSVMGTGIFNMPKDIAQGASLGAVLIGWGIAIFGMLGIVMTFYILTEHFPEIEGGMFNYANHGFGHFVGSLTGWGHWTSAWVGNCSFFIMLFTTLGYFFPAFGNGTTWPAFIGSLILLWAITLLIMQGVRGAALLNTVIVVTKFIPILLFIILCFLAARRDIFTFNIEMIKNFSAHEIFNQVKMTMVTTMWVFLGVEGAITVSEEAHKKKDVAYASLIGFVFVSLIYLLVTFLSFSVMTQEQLEHMKSPAMGYILKEIAGDWGGQFIAVAIIISILGALLSWTVLAAEIPFISAKNEKLFPQFFALSNKNGAPKGSLLVTSVAISLFLLWTLFSKNPDGYRNAFSLASVAAIFPYLLSALFALKMMLQGKAYKSRRGRIFGFFWVSVATLYALWLCLAVDKHILLEVAVLYIPGVFVYLYTKKQNEPVLPGP